MSESDEKEKREVEREREREIVSRERVPGDTSHGSAREKIDEDDEKSSRIWNLGSQTNEYYQDEDYQKTNRKKRKFRRLDNWIIRNTYLATVISY